MPSLRRNRRTRSDKHKPEVVTGNFELHYEDIVQGNKMPIVAIFASALVLLALFIPGVTDKSVADTDRISVEVEQGIIKNPELITQVQNDITASENGYIEFRLPDSNAQ